jgi:parallel beta-helix repeat protein
VKCLCLDNIAFIGAGDRSSVTISFIDNLGLESHNFMALNISFVFDLGNFHASRNSHLTLFECSVTGNNDWYSCFSLSNLRVEKCLFSNCKGVALIVCGRAEVKDSVFSGNNSVGLKVLGAGNAVIKNSKLHGNQWGLDVKFATCDVVNCQIYDNRKMGVGVGNGKVNLSRNEIFHNDRQGIYLCENSFGVIENNEIFENGWYGIATMTAAYCHVSQNKICKNKCGGVHAVPVVSDQQKQSVISCNQIIDNEGPGIDENYMFDDKVGATLNFRDIGKDHAKAKCYDNVLQGNIDHGMPPLSYHAPKICFFCHKRDDLKNCTRCFTAGYCNKDCQKKDWKKHRENCDRLLEMHSIAVKVLPLSSGLIGDKLVKGPIETKAPFEWLKPSGPEYSDKPEKGKRFIVKIQACDTKRKSNDGGTLFAIEDRSLSINGDLDKDEYCRLYHLVRDCGSNCDSYGWKKKFFWAVLGAESNMVRVFISDFPAYQLW